MSLVCYSRLHASCHAVYYLVIMDFYMDFDSFDRDIIH